MFKKRRKKNSCARAKVETEKIKRRKTRKKKKRKMKKLVDLKELIIHGSHVVSGTRCPAGRSGPVKKWSESRAAAPKG